VRWLAAIAARAGGPGGTGVGEGDLPRHEPVRFTQEVSLAFAPSTVRGISRLEAGRFQVDVRFFGLTGPQGPLPTHIVEEAIRRRLDEKDESLEDFLNIFNDRMIAHYYRAWAAHQMCVAMDTGSVDRFDRHIGSLAGLGEAQERRRGDIGSRAKLHYAGLLSLASKPVGGLESLLSDDLEAPVEARPFEGAWVPIPRPMRCRLGDPTSGSRLGVSATLGGRSWEVRQRFGLRVGPVGYGAFQRLLPGGDLHRRMAEWVRLYAGGECACRATLVLRAKETPPASLGDERESRSRLGRTIWLANRPFENDPDDAVVGVMN